MEWADLEMNELFVPNPVNRICGRDMANRIVLGILSPLMTVYHHTWPFDSHQSLVFQSPCLYVSWKGLSTYTSTVTAFKSLLASICPLSGLRPPQGDSYAYKVTAHQSCLAVKIALQLMHLNLM